MGWEGDVRVTKTPKEREVTEANITTLTELGWRPKHSIL